MLTCISSPAIARAPLLPAERDLHIKSCSDHFLTAYEQFQDSGEPSDREEAYRWLRMRDAAVRERVLDEGLDYFAVEGARASRQVMQGAAA